MFAPKTKCQFILYIILFILMIALIPAINFFVVAGFVSIYFFDTLKVGKLLLDCKPRKFLVQLSLFLLFLPWNATIIGIIFVLSAIPATLALPLMILPSYFLNIRSYYRIMKYWWSGNRF